MAESNEHLLEKNYDKWNADLEREDAGRGWKECVQVTKNVTTNENLRLIQYKLMTRVYFSRDKIHKFYETSSDKCLKCDTDKDSLIHAFWYCKVIRATWRKMEQWLSHTCNQNFQLTPEICLFQNVQNIRYPTGWQIIYSSLVLKKVILQNWKNKKPPSFEKWRGLMKYYLNIERTMSEDSNKNKQFDSVWKNIFEAL